MGTVAEMRAAASALISRMNFANWAGITFGGRRDLYQILGYKRGLDYQDYRDRYARDGVAKAVVDAYPDATWRGGVEIYEDEDSEKDTTFEQAFKELDAQLGKDSGNGFWETCHQVDLLAGLSTYAVLLIGVSGETKLSEELPKGESLLFLKPYVGGGGPGVRNNQQQRSESFLAAARVASYEVDPKNPRFGEPASYYIRNTTPGSSFLNYEVHWSRIIHVAEGCKEDNVFGTPTLECVYNLFDDLAKVTGGGSEAFWLRANQGLHVDVDKDMGLPGPSGVVASPGMGKEEREAMRDRFEELQHQLQRVIVTRGTTVNQLGSDVAQFGQSCDALLKQIAGAARIPMRILTGSEMGTLASEQDAANFDSRVQDRRTGYAGPKIVRRIVDRFIEYGILPTPKSYEVGWPVEENMDEKGKSEFALNLAKINQTQGTTVITDDEIRDMAFDKKPLTPQQKIPVATPVRETGVAGDNPDAAGLVKTLRALEDAIESNDVNTIARLVGLQDYKLSTTQVQLPQSFLGFGLKIPDGDLDAQGREDDPHVTVKYGIHTSEANEVRPVVAGRGPITFTLGKTDFFAADGYDVLFVSVQSEDLKRLNAHIAKSLDVTDTQPRYIPHATVAYLKSGLGPKYAGDSTFEGQQHVVSEIVFSNADGERTVLSASGA